MSIIVVAIDRPTHVDAETVAEHLPRYLPGVAGVTVLKVVNDGFVLEAVMEFGKAPEFCIRLAINDAHLEGVTRVEVI